MTLCSVGHVVWVVVCLSSLVVLRLLCCGGCLWCWCVVLIVCCLLWMLWLFCFGCWIVVCVCRSLSCDC